MTTDDALFYFILSNGGIVGLLWMNQFQHCVGGGEGELDKKIMCE